MSSSSSNNNPKPPRPALVVTPACLVLSSSAGLQRLADQPGSKNRAVMVFRPGAGSSGSGSLPRAGEIVHYVGGDGRYVLKVIKQLASTRNQSRFRRHFVSFSPRLLVEIIEVARCGICHGSGAVNTPGECPECRGRGCVDCDEIGVIDWSKCPGCSNAR